MMMIRFASVLALTVAGCAHSPASPPVTASAQAVAEEARPIVAKDEIQGRWVITSINGQKAEGPWLVLGGEGPASIDKTDRGVMIGSPQPPTQAFLGCNNLYLNGWTRNGDKLALGIDYSVKTERGCDAATMTREDALHAIIRIAMTMEFNPPDQLRLVNEKGTIDLRREAP